MLAGFAAWGWGFAGDRCHDDFPTILTRVCPGDSWMPVSLLLLFPIHLNPVHTLRLFQCRDRSHRLIPIFRPIIAHGDEFLLRLPPILVFEEHFVHDFLVVLVLHHFHVGLGLVGGLGEVYDLEVLHGGDLAIGEVLKLVKAEGWRFGCAC